MNKRQRKKRYKRLLATLDERGKRARRRADIRVGYDKFAKFLAGADAQERVAAVIGGFLRDMMTRRSVVSLMFDELRLPFARYLGEDGLVHGAARTASGQVPLCRQGRVLWPDPHMVAYPLTCLACLAEWRDE